MLKCQYQDIRNVLTIPNVNKNKTDIFHIQINSTIFTKNSLEQVLILVLRPYLEGTQKTSQTYLALISQEEPYVQQPAKSFGQRHFPQKGSEILEMFNLFQLVPHSGPLFFGNTPDEVYQKLFFDGITSTNKYAELRVINDIFIWQLNFVTDDDRDTVTSNGIEQSVR